MDRARILGLAERVLRLEAESVLGLLPRLDDRFVEAVALLHRCRGRVIVTAMGKSGIIGRKIAATLASTGTPAYFLHPPRACTAISAWSRARTWCWRCPTRARPTRCWRCCPR
jgi:D-arabinose 5-phosphate isomerase GutQ